MTIPRLAAEVVDCSPIGAAGVYVNGSVVAASGNTVARFCVYIV